MSDDPGDDEPLVLSSSTLNALKEFYAERDARQKQFEDLKAAVEDTAAPLTMEAFDEDWNESQFWYSDGTATALAESLLDGAGKETRVAIVSAPSVFVQVKNLLESKPEDERPKIYLLEFDKRFEIFAEFVFYDFNNPLKLPPSMKGSMNRVIIDPPFLSEECQTRAALTVRWLSQSWGAAESKLIICTGERMEGLISKLYRPAGVMTTTFEPVHSKGLSNEFFCYANFECDKWKWKAQGKKQHQSTSDILVEDCNSTSQ